jgi:mono/diheme cytochrome c family protein
VLGSPKTYLALPLVLLAGVAAGCGEEIEVPESDDVARRGAELFNERCSGCHTLDAAASRGSKPEGRVSGGERTNGPNFNTRKVQRDDVLFAIRNGGFSGAIMPANIVVGEEAEAVADFLEKYSGRKSAEP